MADQKPLFKAPYDIKDVSALFAIVAFVLIIAAIVGNCLLYTSDAADDTPCVDLGGRRIIKKKSHFQWLFYYPFLD